MQWRLRLRSSGHVPRGATIDTIGRDSASRAILKFNMNAPNARDNKRLQQLCNAAAGVCMNFGAQNSVLVILLATTPKE